MLRELVIASTLRCSLAARKKNTHHAPLNQNYQEVVLSGFVVKDSVEDNATGLMINSRFNYHMLLSRQEATSSFKPFVIGLNGLFHGNDIGERAVSILFSLNQCRTPKSTLYVSIIENNLFNYFTGR